VLLVLLLLLQTSVAVQRLYLTLPFHKGPQALLVEVVEVVQLLIFKNLQATAPGQSLRERQ
jgi:hypothetical protein